MHNANNSNFQIRSVQPEDATAVVAFLNRVYGSWGNIDHWRWKYLEPPAPFRFDSILAEHQGEIVGHYGMLPLEAVIDGQVIPIAQAIDAAVSPNHRHKGLFTTLALEALTRAACDGAKFIYAFPGLLSLDANIQLGFKAAGYVPEQTCLINFPEALRLSISCLPGDLHAVWAYYRRKKLSPELTKSLIRFWHSLFFIASFLTSPNIACQRRLSKNEFEAVVYAIDQFDNCIDEMWKHMANTIPLGILKNSRYLNWRYFSSLSCRYDGFAIDIGGVFAGYLIMKHMGARYEIAELYVLPEYSAASDRLLRTALSRARKNNIVSLHIWANDDHPINKNLQRAGFVTPSRLHKLANHWKGLANKTYQVIFYTDHLSPNQQMNLSSKLNAWQLSKGDSDLL